jgi:hypothetical protein
MVMRIIGRRIDRKRPRRAVLEALIDRQDDELSGATEMPLRQDAGEVGFDAGVVRFVPREDVFDGGGEGHGIRLRRVRKY